MRERRQLQSRPESVEAVEVDLVRATAVSLAVEEPGILRQLRKDLLSEGDDPHVVEVVAEPGQQRARVSRMSNLCGNHERHPTLGLQQARCHNEKRSP